MTKTILQIENTTVEDLKAELLSGVNEALKNFSTQIQGKNNDILLTREETAEMLSVSLVTLWKWTKDDVIPAFRIGNRVRFKKSEVLEAMQKMNRYGEEDN
ncbi:MAG: helix-turn-helix domain-containing protein [Flavobacteriales bacterium]|nr:helix-turn-helix domain-containing protein [Flavobacteriales bacterium]PIQ17304.1 MAG: DNA-binding protein [Flavobacteriaceae bacterium CG18_big_fil_WC_8_21_14_2_50_34_36]